MTAAKGCAHLLREGINAECFHCREARFRAEHGLPPRQLDTAARLAEQAEHYRRTEHCGQCGNPGQFCTCRSECGCHELHPVGSGLAPDALEAFAVVEVPADQDELW